jgi:hypothetical protein
LKDLTWGEAVDWRFKEDQGMDGDVPFLVKIGGGFSDSVSEML